MPLWGGTGATLCRLLYRSNMNQQTCWGGGGWGGEGGQQCVTVRLKCSTHSGSYINPEGQSGRPLLPLSPSSPIHPLGKSVHNQRNWLFGFFVTNTLIGRQVDAVVFRGYLQLELELRQHWQQQVAVDVVELQDEVKHVFGQIADRRLAQHQDLVEELEEQRTEHDTGVSLQTPTQQKSLQDYSYLKKMTFILLKQKQLLWLILQDAQKNAMSRSVFERDSRWWCRARWPEPSSSAALWPGHMLVYSNSGLDTENGCDKRSEKHKTDETWKKKTGSYVFAFSQWRATWGQIQSVWKGCKTHSDLQGSHWIKGYGG